MREVDGARPSRTSTASETTLVTLQRANRAAKDSRRKVNVLLFAVGGVLIVAGLVSWIVEATWRVETGVLGALRAVSFGALLLVPGIVLLFLALFPIDRKAIIAVHLAAKLTPTPLRLHSSQYSRNMASKS